LSSKKAAFDVYVLYKQNHKPNACPYSRHFIAFYVDLYYGNIPVPFTIQSKTLNPAKSLLTVLVLTGIAFIYEYSANWSDQQSV
jgi:hypothetical protein